MELPYEMPQSRFISDLWIAQKYSSRKIKYNNIIRKITICMYNKSEGINYLVGLQSKQNHSF